MAKFALSQWPAALAHELRPAQLFSTLTAGFIIGALAIIVNISTAALIFSGDLAVYLPRGIGLTLFGGLVFCVVQALTSSYVPMVALPQDISAVIFGIMALNIARALPHAASEDVFDTILVAMIGTSILVGVVFCILGWLRSGNLVRFVPHPVMGGFLAGTGWLLARGGLNVITGTAVHIAQLPGLLRPAMFITWVPGVLFASALIVITRYSRHYLTMPIMILAALMLFYVGLAAAGISLADASARGWLLGPFPTGALWQPPGFAVLTQAHWPTLLAQGAHVATLLLLCAIALLLNVNGLEVTARQDLNVDRELISAGFANLLAGAGGSPVGFQTLGFSALGPKMGSRSRLVGILAGLLGGAAFLYGTDILARFPRFVLGGMVLFMGLSFLIDWLYDGWFRLSKTDYALVVGILLVIGVFGFLQGVGVGILAAVSIFALNYSRTTVIKHTFDGTTFTSNVERSASCQRILREHGQQILLLQLQGYIFFGTAHSVLAQVQQRIQSPDIPALRFLVLDFRQVKGVDSSALNTFIRIKQIAEAQEMTVIFTHLPADFQRQFDRSGLLQPDNAVVRLFPDVDHGFEWCEEQLLLPESRATGRNAAFAPPQNDARFLDAILEELWKDIHREETFEALTAEMITYLEHLEIPEGACLIRQGGASEYLYLLESGQVTVQIEQHAGQTARLRVVQAGTILGEVGFYLGHRATASVIASQPCTVYRLSQVSLQQMEQTNPALALAFHKFIARLQSERLLLTHRTLETLLQ